MFGINEPGIGVYRPNDNPVIDWLQTWGRLRSNKDMIDRKDLKGMIRALKRRSDLVCAGPRLRPGRQRIRAALCRRPGGNDVGDTGCWQRCRKPALFRSFRDVNPTVKVMS